MVCDIFSDDIPCRKEIDYVIGQDLSLFSLEDIDERIILLQREIMRLEEARSKKDMAKKNAESVFKF